MDVVFVVFRQVVVDDQGHLLDINTSGQQVGGNQNSGRTGSEFSHNLVSVLLGHVGVDEGDGEVVLGQLLGQLLDLSSGVTEDDGLGDGDGVVQVGKTVVLVFLLVDVDVELLDTFQGQFVLLHKNLDRVSQEGGGDGQDFSRHGSRKQDQLGGFWQVSQDVVDLFLETLGKHFIGFIHDEHLDVLNLEDTSLDHVEDSTWSTNDNLGAGVQGSDIVGDGGTTNTSVDGNFHVGGQGEDNLLDLQGQFSGWGQDQGLGGLDVLVDSLQGRDGEGGSLTGTGLGLGQDISTVNNRQNGLLLNGGRSFETKTENTSKNSRLEVQLVEGGGDLVVVGVENTVLGRNSGHD